MGVTVAHSGKQHAYRHAFSVQQLGLLDRFITSTYYKRDCFPDRIMKSFSGIDYALQKRFLKGLNSTKIIRRSDLEMPELWYRKVIKNGSLAENAMFRRDTKFDQWVANRFAGESEIFWGFQGSCHDSLGAAKANQRVAVCEFATAHVTAAKRYLSEEAERHPEWAGTISNFHFPNWYLERLEQEPHRADICIAASGFTQKSLEEVGISEDKIRVLPLGVDIEQFDFVQRKVKGRLKVLFVGGIGQRKGIKYLLQAIKKVNSKSIELQLLGPMASDPTPLKEWGAYFEYLGQTDQSGVAKQMQQSDVLVLPSVFEGFGLVILEAMATGLPVIASTHSCAPDVIEDGTHGFVLAPDDVEGLSEKLAWCAENRQALVEMNQANRLRAQDYSWNNHKSHLREVIASLSK